MELTEYQGLARRTQNPALNRHQRLEHALFGLCSEVGEIHSIYQKGHQGHPVCTEAVVDELGDLLWFAGELCDVLGVDLGDVARFNVEKLKTRYPDGFSTEKSLNREV